MTLCFVFILRNTTFSGPSFTIFLSLGLHGLCLMCNLSIQGLSISCDSSILTHIAFSNPSHSTVAGNSAFLTWSASSYGRQPLPSSCTSYSWHFGVDNSIVQAHLHCHENWLLALSCLSVHLRISAWLPLDGFS